jgi:hypothetical protein
VQSADWGRDGPNFCKEKVRVSWHQIAKYGVVFRVRVHGFAQQEGKRRGWNTWLLLVAGEDTDGGLARGVGRGQRRRRRRSRRRRQQNALNDSH